MKATEKKNTKNYYRFYVMKKFLLPLVEVCVLGGGKWGNEHDRLRFPLPLSYLTSPFPPLAFYS